MFYSQFILAKKGPLGTIWIAAHLERKLRKNQVADTDIGVSVDSILFPEVPIALRLSSHLLLGVVRIYSRKVNYLFDDCSEALLKIKQAFRSTAVDLPPEESTAPYHSITLPETFDLDDFELPESELFQGTYVDHHVSSREQITLQDNMDNVAYPSSQFGLDERFGDGDTSQIGLDLEEEMLLVKASAPGQGGVIKTALQEFDETVVKEEPSNLEAMQEDGNGDQVNDLDEASELADYAQAPATPCLVEVSNLSNVKERLILDDHMESEDQHLTAVAAAECGEDISQKLDHHPGDKSSEDQSLSNKLNHDSLACMPCENGLDDGTLKDQTMSLVSSPPNTISAEYKSVDGNKVEDGVIVGTDCKNRLNGEGVESPSCSNVTFDMEDPSRTNVLTSEKCMENENGGVPLKPVSENDVKTANNDDESYIPSKETTVNAACQLESPSRATVVDDETQACLDANYQGLYKSSTHEEVSSVGTHTIKPCNTCFNQQNNVSHEGCDSSVLQNMRSDAADQLSLDNVRGENEYNAFEASTGGQGEGCQSQMSERDFCEKAQVACGNSDERPDNVISGDNQMENSNNYGASELPAPEKLLCVPETLLDGPNDLLVETTPDKEVPAGDDEIGTISKAVSGKKRSYTESTLTMESINSVESFGGNRSKRTAECIPDDDDLLSSILVGRRSSVLKMKTTPAFEVASKKRVRSVTRTSAMKRKVLLDDMMVLHGDAIRQQLTNTEDIRRVRKKAPCTRPEISMIQRQFLEHEIFSEPIFSGMSLELASLYSGTHDLSRIGISECKDNHPPEGSNNLECSVEQKVTEGNGIGHSNDAQRQLDGIVQIETQCLDHDINTQEHISSGPGGPHTLEGENLDINELHIDERSAEAADAANMFGLDEMMNLTNPVTTAYNNIFDGETQIVDASQSSDALCISPDQYMKIEAVKESAVILSNGDGTNHAEALDHIVDDTVVGLESIARGDNLYEESGGTLADVPAAHQEYSISISNKCGFPPTSVEGNPGLDEEKQNVPNEDMFVAASSELNDQGPSFNGGEEPKPDSGDPEHNACNENASTNVENQMWGTNAVHVGIDAHDHLVEENRGEFEGVAVANDTDFLNLDDDEVDEDDDDDEMPSTEDRQLLENSGWSSRTRAVARYLQNLFDSENVHGRKVLSTDGLLTGKTRKEAARMFFETLVLKTKDYIQVEQPKAFGDINIKPRATLMKSIF